MANKLKQADWNCSLKFDSEASRVPKRNYGKVFPNHTGWSNSYLSDKSSAKKPGHNVVMNAKC